MSVSCVGANPGPDPRSCVGMAQLILIPTAQTGWRAQGRLAGDTDLPLDEYGHRQAVAIAEAIAPLRPVAIHCGAERAAKQTATIIAHDLKLKCKPAKELRELDLGLWEGLTLEDLRERFGRVYRQWRADLFSVEPPEGEAASTAAERLHAAVARLARKHHDHCFAAVLGQFAYALARCQCADGSYDRVWEYVDGETGWHFIERPRLEPVAREETEAGSPPGEGDHPSPG